MIQPSFSISNMHPSLRDPFLIIPIMSLTVFQPVDFAADTRQPCSMEKRRHIIHLRSVIRQTYSNLFTNVPSPPFSRSTL
jgi:hypothetical protein